MPHLYTHIYPTIATILLLRAIVQIRKSQRLAQQLPDLLRRQRGLLFVHRVQRVVVEGDTIDDTNEEERPVRTAFGHFDVAAVVDGEEDVGGFCKVWEGVFDGQGVGRLHEHEGHGRPEEDDVRVDIFGEDFTLEVSGNHQAWMHWLRGRAGDVGEVTVVNERWGVAYSSQNAMLCH